MTRFLRILLTILSGAATLLAVIVVLSWLTGRVVSDRHALSQWLAWIPTPALFPAVLVGLLCASWQEGRPWIRRFGVRAWLAVGVALTVYFGVVEHRFLHRAADPGDAVSIVNWNMSYDSAIDHEGDFLGPAFRLLGDVTVLVNAGGLHDSDEFLDGLPKGTIVAIVGNATVLSRYPILEARAFVISDHGRATLLRIAGFPGLDRPLIVYVVDLPSDPRRSREKITRTLRVHLDNAGAPPPDIVLGDFNIPRGSASLAEIFPDMRDAYAEAGHGYGASFHREFPLYHIDHVLLGEDMACRRYDLIDAGIGRHHVQRAYVEARR